ncbi:hypothetical protein NKH71_06610 [Mesorhizobium sp. M0983]|uniref:hypothetical protein n=1 Tax=Mesorhizobium sp. M0983 TaxID=2957040 RepID=UPI003338AC48
MTVFVRNSAYWGRITRWSGRTRYAAAMFFYKRGEMSAETLEVYRICARLDSTDPLPIIRDRGIGQDWLKRIGFE